MTRYFNIFILLFSAVLHLTSNLAVAQVNFVVTETPDNQTDPDSSVWLMLAPNSVLFETEAENILLADEVEVLPGLNSTGLGRETGTLNFFGRDTGFTWSFSITADETVAFPNHVAAGFTYNDTEGGDIFRTGALSPGDVGNFENDDVSFRFFGKQDIFGFGFDLLDSNVSTGETLSVFDQNENLIGRLDLPPGPDGVINNFFLGVTSSIPIGRITFDENAGPDDIAIRDLRFATSFSVLLGDVNLDGSIDLLDIASFVDRLTIGPYQIEADTNLDGEVDLLDVGPFVSLLTGR